MPTTDDVRRYLDKIVEDVAQGRRKTLRGEPIYAQPLLDPLPNNLDDQTKLSNGMSTTVQLSMLWQRYPTGIFENRKAFKAAIVENAPDRSKGYCSTVLCLWLKRGILEELPNKNIKLTMTPEQYDAFEKNGSLKKEHRRHGPDYYLALLWLDADSEGCVTRTQAAARLQTLGKSLCSIKTILWELRRAGKISGARGEPLTLLSRPSNRIMAEISHGYLLFLKDAALLWAAADQNGKITSRHAAQVLMDKGRSLAAARSRLSTMHKQGWLMWVAWQQIQLVRRPEPDPAK